MNARKKIEKWSTGVKEHLEAISQASSRGADLEAFLEFMQVRVGHDEALWKEYTKPRWARLRVNLLCGKQRAFANFFIPLSALEEVKSQRLVVAYGAGRWVPGKESIPAPSTSAHKECAHCFVTIAIDAFRTSHMQHELGCAIQRVELEKCQPSPEDTEKYGALI
jgi:hypothetical protein